MIVFVAELDASDDISEHSSAEYEVSWHEDLLNEQLVFGTEDHASPQEKKTYHNSKKKEYSLEYLKQRIHT